LEGLGWALGLALEKGEGFSENVLSRETRPLFWASHGFGLGFQGTVAGEACTFCEPVYKIYDTGIDK
jgi:hypothetical protein